MMPLQSTSLRRLFGVGLVMLALVAAGCDDEEGGAPPPRPGQPGAPGAAPPPRPQGNQLTPRAHVEDAVICPAAEKATGPVCDPGAPSCDAGLYCIPVATGGHACEACPERDSIRHEFNDRDFVADQVRDPFQSYVTPQKGLEAPPEKRQEGPCNRAEQFIASNYSYLELRLVGIVAQGTQRKVLMMDPGNLGQIIRRGDCVGKEKAVVKDIGPGFVTFVVQPDPDDRTPNRIPEERSVQLHPKGLQVQMPTQPNMKNAVPTAPIVAPPTN